MTVSNVIVGAASGMGEAVARRLASRSRRLLLADRNEPGARRLAEELGAESIGCDLTSDDDLMALVSAVDEPGAVVVTAGLSPTMASGRAIFAVNLVGPARLLEQLEPLASPQSVAVLFSSTAGHMLPEVLEVDPVLDAPLSPSLLDELVAAGVDVDDPATAYLYSKRGVLRLVRRRAKAWGARGARLLSVSPGIIDTPMGRAEAKAQPLMADLVAATALRRTINADEVAAVVEFLVSDDASAMTGSDVLVDAGSLG